MEEIKINLDNLTAEERETLMKLVEKGNKPRSRVPHPTQQNKGYVINWCGSRVNCGGVFVDDALKCADEFGFWFPTKEEAEDERTRRKMLTKWKRLSIEAGEDENPWNGTSGHWFVFLDPKSGIGYNYHQYIRHGLVTFPSKASLKAAVAELGEDKVKRYILGVRE